MAAASDRGPLAAADERQRRQRAAFSGSPSSAGSAGLGSRSVSPVAAGKGLLGYSGAYESTVQASWEVTARRQIHFLGKIRATDAYRTLAHQVGQKTVEDRVDALCAACWRLYQESTATDAASLKSHLLTTSLNAQKQICAMRSTVTHEDQELLEFYEPLQHVDPVSRDLVLHMVVDKLQQLEDNTAPGSLVHKLLDYVRRCKRGGDRSKDDFDEDAVEPELLATLRAQPHRDHRSRHRVPASAIAEFGGPPRDPLARADRLGRVCEDLEDENEELRDLLSAQEQELKYRRQAQDERLRQLAQEQHRLAMEARAREEEEARWREGKVDVEMLRRIFENMDKDGDGEVELSDFLTSSQNGSELRWLLRGGGYRAATAGSRQSTAAAGPRRKSSVARDADGSPKRASFALAPDQGTTEVSPASAARHSVSRGGSEETFARTLQLGDLLRDDGGVPDGEGPKRASFALAPDQGTTEVSPASAARHSVSWGGAEEAPARTLQPGDLLRDDGGVPDGEGVHGAAAQAAVEESWRACYFESTPQVPEPDDSASGSDDSSNGQQSFEELFLELAGKRGTMNFQSFVSFFERRGTMSRSSTERDLDEDANVGVVRQSSSKSSARSGPSRASVRRRSSLPPSAGGKSPSGPVSAGGETPSSSSLQSAQLAMAAAASSFGGGSQPGSPASRQSTWPAGLARPGSAPRLGPLAAELAPERRRWSLGALGHSDGALQSSSHADGAFRSPSHPVNLAASPLQGTAPAAVPDRSDDPCAAGLVEDAGAERLSAPARAESPRLQLGSESATEPGGGARSSAHGEQALGGSLEGCEKVSLGTQTDVAGDYVAQLQAEVERYASLLKDLSDRFGELLSSAKVQQVIRGATSSMPALQRWYVRLYADAQDRGARHLERQGRHKDGQVVLLRHWSTPDAKEWGGLAVVDTPVAEPRYPELPAAMLLGHQYQRNSGFSTGARAGQRAAEPATTTPTAGALGSPGEPGGPERPRRVLLQDEEPAEEAPPRRAASSAGPAAAEAADRRRGAERPWTSGGARDYRDVLLASGGDGAARGGAAPPVPLAELPVVRPRSAASGGSGAPRGRRAGGRRGCLSLSSSGPLNLRRTEARQDVRVVRPDILAPAR